MRTYRVYVIKERSSGAAKYVGMTFQTLHKRFNQHVRMKRFSPKDYLIELVQEDLNQESAVVLEEMLINQYETRKNGWNLAPKSVNGYSKPHSAERKAQWSKERKGKPFAGVRTTRDGHKNTPSQNRKIAEANSKPIICMNDGKAYASIREACKKLGLQESKVSLVCSGKRPHTKGYKFKCL